MRTTVFLITTASICMFGYMKFKVLRTSLIVFLLLFSNVFALNAFALSDSGKLKELSFESFSQKAPEIRFKDNSGKEFRLSSYKDNHFVLLHLWSTWCSPCQEEIPSLINFVKKWNESRVVLLSISVDKEAQRNDVQKFLKEHHIDEKAFIIEEDDDSKKYYAWGIPMTYLIDPNGEIFARGLGMRHWDQISKEKFSHFLTEYLSKTKK